MLWLIAMLLFFSGIFYAYVTFTLVQRKRDIGLLRYAIGGAPATWKIFAVTLAAVLLEVLVMFGLNAVDRNAGIVVETLLFVQSAAQAYTGWKGLK